MSVLKFAPRAGVAVTEFDKENRTVELIGPKDAIDTLLISIDFDKRSWANQRKSGEVFQPKYP